MMQKTGLHLVFQIRKIFQFDLQEYGFQLECTFILYSIANENFRGIFSFLYLYGLLKEFPPHDQKGLAFVWVFTSRSDLNNWGWIAKGQ